MIFSKHKILPVSTHHTMAPFWESLKKISEKLSGNLIIISYKYNGKFCIIPLNSDEATAFSANDCANKKKEKEELLKSSFRRIHIVNQQLAYSKNRPLVKGGNYVLYYKGDKSDTGRYLCTKTEEGFEYLLNRKPLKEYIVTNAEYYATLTTVSPVPHFDIKKTSG